MMTAYLDNSATTCPAPEVIAAAEQAMRGGWYNPSALYKPAMEVQKALEETRALCLRAVKAEGHRVIFTGGGTEADNLALLGILKGKRKPGRVLISEGEHPAVLACGEEIRRMGHEALTIPLTPEGRVNLDALEEMLDESVHLIAVMQVNNETGAVQPISEIADSDLCFVRPQDSWAEGNRGPDCAEGSGAAPNRLRRGTGGWAPVRHREHAGHSGTGYSHPDLGPGKQ